MAEAEKGRSKGDKSRLLTRQVWACLSTARVGRVVYKMNKDFFQIRKLILGTKNREANS